ncbi:MAG TPA: hypothetical protein VFU25_09925 [Ornithinibacter sp.]|nr:hypothetical protein [Ornithinibacter sp.]
MAQNSQSGWLRDAMRPGDGVIQARLNESKKYPTNASAPFSDFSLAAAGTADDLVGDGLGDPDALDDGLLTDGDGVGDAVGGVPSA